MRAYAVDFAPSTINQRAVLVFAVPTADKTITYTRQSGEWYMSFTDEPERYFAAAQIMGGAPLKEWTFDVPETVFNNPSGGYPMESDDSPLNRWVIATSVEFDLGGTPLPEMTREEFDAHVRARLDSGKGAV